MRRTAQICCLLVLPMLPCACGGSAQGTNSSGSSVDTTAVTQQVVDAINQARSQRGLSTLGQSATVAKNAVAAAEANLTAYLADATAQGTGAVGLVHYRNGPAEGAIVAPDTVKENLYATTSQSAANVPSDAIALWLASKSTATTTGHCENLLFANHHSLGVGVAAMEDARGRTAIVVSAGLVCTTCVRNVHPSCL